jgi:hypothetical protein
LRKTVVRLRDDSPKKSRLEFSSEPASLEFVSYANLIAIVVMIPMVAVVAVPVVV